MIEVIKNLFLAGYVTLAGWFGLNVPVEEVATTTITENITPTETQNFKNETVTLLDLEGRPLFSKNNTTVWILGEMPPEPLQIPGADPKTFEPLIYPYSKDAITVFKFAQGIPMADPATFRILKSNLGFDLDYGVDKNAVYFGTDIIEGADPESFMLVDSDSVTDFHHAKDKNRKYFQGRAIE